MVRVRGVRRLVRALRRAPNPRLTALGTGLFCTAVMLLVGWLDQHVLGGSMLVYGVLFLPVSVVTALWVRRADLAAAPVAVPIAFAAGAVPLTGGSGGLGGRAVGLFTALALYAGWLYGGTLIAGTIATVRRIRLIRQLNRRNAGRRAQQPANGRVTGRSAGGRTVGRTGEADGRHPRPEPPGPPGPRRRPG